ncbi:hypothetical protein L484_020836 [Morus notabilis]|uniref:Uncharacterized protein n=1 Tax=Morus notabilis TaxID=981085 RepID=W9QRL0_9ROSA|nr:hypothetical protein L484_020836 [Morus notabilis]
MLLSDHHRPPILIKDHRMVGGGPIKKARADFQMLERDHVPIAPKMRLGPTRHVMSGWIVGVLSRAPRSCGAPRPRTRQTDLTRIHWVCYAIT